MVPEKYVYYWLIKLHPNVYLQLLRNMQGKRALQSWVSTCNGGMAKLEFYLKGPLVYFKQCETSLSPPWPKGPVAIVCKICGPDVCTLHPVNSISEQHKTPCYGPGPTGQGTSHTQLFRYWAVVILIWLQKRWEKGGSLLINWEAGILQLLNYHGWELYMFYQWID